MNILFVFKTAWRKTKLWAKTIRNYASNHPALFGVYLGMAVVFTVMGTVGVADYQKNKAQVAQLEPLREITTFDLQNKIKDKQVKELVNHYVDVGSFLVPNKKKITEIVYFKPPSQKIHTEEVNSSFWEEINKLALQYPFSIKEGYDGSSSNRLYGWASTGLFLLLLITVLVMAQKLVGEVISGHSFKPQKRDMDLMMKDVIGYEDVKQELFEVMDQIRHASAYEKKGIVAPRGILLTGDPGVGKTMMAKAMANEMGAEFFYCTGSDFVEMYVGVGPKRVRTLFKQARNSRMAFIFIDEIDAIGSRNKMGSDSERQATINQMLAEMDGVNKNKNLLILGATNHTELMDPALLRPGRFDKKIHVPLPDLSTRKGILERYLGNIAIDETLDLDALAQRTQGYSGAQLSSLVAEAKNLSLRESKGEHVVVSQELIERAQEIAILGISEQKAEPEDLERVSIHELGHALLGYLYCRSSHVEKVTLVGRGKALGYTLSRPLKETQLKTEQELRYEVMMMLAGRAAEEVILGSVSSGAADDLMRANHVVKRMVCDLGMGKQTGLRTQPDSMDPGAKLPDGIEQDIRSLLNELYVETKKLISLETQWFEIQNKALLEEKILGHNRLFVNNPPLTRKI